MRSAIAQPSAYATRSLALDLLRSAAIALVVFRHGISVPDLPRPDSAFWEVLYQISNNGWLGVDLFFVLSGFLIAGQIIREISATGRLNWRIFLLRRALRTLPAYYFVMILLWLGACATVLGTDGVREPGVLLAHMIFLNDYVQPSLHVTFWSLASEEKFYLMMIFLMPLFARSPVVGSTLVIFGACLVSISRYCAFAAVQPGDYPEFFWRLRAPFHFALEGLLLGTGVALIRQTVRLSPNGCRCFLAIGGSLAISVLLLNGWRWDGEVAGAVIAIPAFSCAIAMVVFGANLSSTNSPTGFFSRFCVWLATISFSLYLAHYAVARAVFALYPKLAMTSPAIYWVVYILGSLLLGYALYICVERPGLRLRDRILAHSRSNSVANLQ